MFFKSRTYFKHKAEYLYYLQNDLGFNDLEICISGNRQDGSIWFSEWLNFFELLHKGKNEIVWRDLTRDTFIEKCTHRRILDIELVLDIDDMNINDYKYFNQDLLEKTRIVINNLISNKKKLQIDSYFIYFTGSKSFHIHCFISELRNKTPNEREKFKRFILSELKCDIMKSSNRTMIALEGEKHYKSGKEKIEVTDIWK